MREEFVKVLAKIIDDFINVRTFITLGAFALAYILTYQAKPIPELLRSIIDLLLGFWFGQKVAQAKKEGEGK